jgi:hypothetical protein
MNVICYLLPVHAAPVFPTSTMKKHNEIKVLLHFNQKQIPAMVRRKKAASGCKEVPTKEDSKKFKEQILYELHVISEGSIDQIKLLAEGHGGIIDRLDRMEEENERQHLETRALVNVPNLITLRETPRCLQTC